MFLFPEYIPTGSTSKIPSYHRKARQSQQNSSKCIVRPPDPWDASILEYVLNDKLAKKLTCQDAKVQPEITFLDTNSVLHRNETAIGESGLDVDCYYRSYDKKNGDDEMLEYTDWILFNSSTPINTEFVEVSCQRSWFPHNKVYSNNHYQLLPLKPISTLSEAQNPSVIIIVLDSVSHSNFVRTMNKTMKVLTDTYQSHIFDGMTKVGDNSFSNAVAFLAGKWWNTEFGDIQNNFDDHPIIWRNFAANGYRTLYAEDYPGFNLFNYLSKGFRQKPVDHYFRPFWLNVYWSYVHRRSKNLCYGNNPMHKLQLGFLEQFVQKYQGQPKFAVSWLTELGHDWLNQIRYGDEDIANFLSNNQKELENSYIFLMSDHGHRFDSIRRTTVGRIEERLPFFSLSLPKSMRTDKKLISVINSNTKKLTSFWDVYATFRYILDPKEQMTRGTSLLTPVQDRNCMSANIPDEFCVCESEESINVNDEIIGKLAKDLTREINLKLKKHAQCAILVLKKIHTASAVGDDVDQKYRISIEVAPSNAIFEALLIYNPDTLKSTVIGDINRINKYGSQSICVNDQYLRKLCFCTTFLDSIPA